MSSGEIRISDGTIEIQVQDAFGLYVPSNVPSTEEEELIARQRILRWQRQDATVDRSPSPCSALEVFRTEKCLLDSSLSPLRIQVQLQIRNSIVKQLHKEAKTLTPQDKSSCYDTTIATRGSQRIVIGLGTHLNEEADDASQGSRRKDASEEVTVDKSVALQRRRKGDEWQSTTCERRTWIQVRVLFKSES